MNRVLGARSPQLPLTRGLILAWILLDLTIVAATSIAPMVFAIFLCLCLYVALERQPEVALAFAVAGLPILDWINRAGGPPPSLIPLELVLLFPPVLWIAALGALEGASSDDPKSEILARTLLDPLVFVSILFGMVLLVGLSWTPAPTYGRSKVMLFATVCFPLLIGSRVILGRAETRAELVHVGFQFLRGIVLFEAVIAISGIVNLFLELYPYRTRLNVLALNVIWLARHMGLALLCTLLLLAAGRLRRSIGVPLAVLFAYVFYLAGSRGPLVALVVSLVVWWLLHRRASMARFFAIGGFVMVLTAGLLWWMETGATPFGGHDISNLARLFLLRGAFERLGSVGILGPGTGSFPSLLGFGDTRLYPHNLFLEVLVENGLLGFTVIALLVFLTVRRWREAQAFFEQGGAPAMPQAWLLRTGGLVWLYTIVNAQFSGDLTTNQWIWVWTGAVAAWAERR